MGKDWRYRLKHIGDTFADLLDTTIETARGSAVSVAIGIHIRGLNKKKGQVAAGIGFRVIELRNQDPNLLIYDEKIGRFYQELDELDLTIQECIDSRERMKDRLRKVFSCCSPKTVYEAEKESVPDSDRLMYT